MKRKVNTTELELIQGDITELDVDAIVNAANERLSHGGGVAGVIARKGGPVIQEESNDWIRRHGWVATGSAGITSGGDLPAQYVIHAVGPVYKSSSRPAEFLASAIHASLRMGEEHDVKSIAFPAISTGIFGYPMKEAAEVMLRAAIEYLEEEETGIERVIFCLYGDFSFRTFESTLQDLLPEAT